ncbi:MAG: threonylcarbamoyl-AMP synthase [Bacilli bacterium]|nr:threonylcarbamoyl-AMP synthase [Bacilli bacterium]
MKTRILQEKDIDEAASLLLKGEVVAFPTETVYGVGVIATKEEAYNALVASKRRPPAKPFSMMLSSLKDLEKYAEIGPKVRAVIEKYMPGEITVLVKAKSGLPHWVTLGTEIIGIRIPDSEFVLSLIDKVGAPLLVTSANHSGEPTSTSFDVTYKTFDGEIAGIVSGKCVSEKASTIVNISSEENIVLVREGPIPFIDIKTIWENAK